MSCMYCDIKEYTDRSYNNTKVLELDGDRYTALAMVYHNENKEFTMMADGASRAEIKINYCPVCGRKLS